MTSMTTEVRALGSYVRGQWVTDPNGTVIVDAVYGQPVATVGSGGVDFAGTLAYARERGAILREFTFHERAAMLRSLAVYLTERKEAFYELSFKTGTTRRDAVIDIDGGIGTLFSYSSLVRRELPNETFVVEDDVNPLGKGGTFYGRHVLTPREGVALHINAYNFPVWGMLEKFAPNFVAGMPAIVKPASQTAFLTEAVVQAIVESGILPEGSLQLICGSTGDLFDHLREQDVVTFTGSAATAAKLKTHPNIVARSIPFNTEADSLNCIILGRSVRPDEPEFDLFVREVVTEMTAKAGQKCTAIRRAILPRERVDDVVEAIRARLSKVTLGDPSRDDVRMGPLVSATQRDGTVQVVQELSREARVVIGHERPEILGGDFEKGGFMAPTLLVCDEPLSAKGPHELEAFGPVATLMPYDTLQDAVKLARMGAGSLVGSIVTYDRAEAKTLFFGMASAHGRVLILNRDDAKESTGHGSPLPTLVHGGPGRAGGGEELGGLRAVTHYMQRTAVQADPTTMMVLTGEYVRGASVVEDVVHPFRKNFDELRVGDSLLTHRRTVTEADIVNFANVTGDYFYAHVDDIAAKESPIFGKRVAHGYFLISAAAGLFVSPAPGPVLANYGLEDLRFVEPVGIGDTIRARLTVKSKTAKDPKPGEPHTGVVEWAVDITNQHDQLVATYSILTLVERAK
ncbi:phenylacetic acid degradation bifunctional protein PaaZ [Deinococcus yavapaiensis]|uniref:Oxepin-CoA hydrolase/3-oxo-5,6-dehydrosuberyl-CoA semialdehyde dehydrogenase n=1 Tax=Deinococcus yavapaiensis KR-236 TaxID=694435 RepID=A0A318SED7_9DEIO|nr:phenylacetic acid degradation bifunctional protein PaaZ [Deinococcus yavapaiensis]PYE55461.1 oxepin-CoA hydrolase/3-oxo-5,6-dehydrosuberyl-CoA semialdehyde dehydrogenase [Deinococcus yavapaiensis KR-236]